MMTHRITTRWNDKNEWFRDEMQCSAVATVILHRLADDRRQEECRYLTRLKWHLHMSYQEVSYAELVEHVEPAKMKILNHLFDAIADGQYDDIDNWITECTNMVPIIEDKWINANRDSDYVKDLFEGDLERPR